MFSFFLDFNKYNTFFTIATLKLLNMPFSINCIRIDDNFSLINKNTTTIPKWENQSLIASILNFQNLIINS
jgi:hypothetical protein